jgi:hypothetical protein
LIALGLVGAAPLAYEAGRESAEGDGPQPANKTSIASSAVEIFGPQERVTLLSTTIKTASPTDVVIQVTAECDILTQLTTVGNDVAEASAAIRMWVELDGVPVVVNSAEPAEDAGKVTFCDRIHKQTTSDFDDEDATIEQFLKSRSANAFNWISLDLGHGTHTVEIIGTLTQETAGDATAQGVVGKRTLVVEPMMLAHGTTN